jgi:hypothetical protein
VYRKDLPALLSDLLNHQSEEGWPIPASHTAPIDYKPSPSWWTTQKRRLQLRSATRPESWKSVSSRSNYSARRRAPRGTGLMQRTTAGPSPAAPQSSETELSKLGSQLPLGTPPPCATPPGETIALVEHSPSCSTLPPIDLNTQPTTPQCRDRVLLSPWCSDLTPDLSSPFIPWTPPCRLVFLAIPFHPSIPLCFRWCSVAQRIVYSSIGMFHQSSSSLLPSTRTQTH